MLAVVRALIFHLSLRAFSACQSNPALLNISNLAMLSTSGSLSSTSVATAILVTASVQFVSNVSCSLCLYVNTDCVLVRMFRQ